MSTATPSLTPASSAKPIVLEQQYKQRSLVRDAARRFARNRLAMFGLIILIILLFLAVFADVIAPYKYDDADFSIVNELPFQDPAHILGADSIGRDYMTRLIYGARTSFTIGLAVPTISFAVSFVLGAISGYRRGALDFIIQRIVEIMQPIPPLMLAAILLDFLGPSIFNMILVLGITSWIDPTNLTRAQFLTFRDREFVVAARAIGASDREIILSHILPNALAPLLVAFTFAVPGAIFGEAGLSFLGLGITEPTASWGKMVGAQIGSSAVVVFYHLALFPAILVALTMLGFSFVGDGLQEALDPQRTR